MHAAAITSEGLARAHVGPLAPSSKHPAVAEPPRQDISAPPCAAALPTDACPRAERLGALRHGATAMDAFEQWAYAALWLCCLFSLVYCFATLF